MVMSDRWRMSPGLRRTSAFVAIVALAISGAKIASDHTMPGSGFSTVATVAADPTGPTGGGMTGPPGGGSQFQPPGLPPQQPDYQGGNQPPLDQNNGISIYNSGAPQAGQQAPGQQAGQQPQQSWDQPAHGSQIPDYQTATPYTQGPGKANPDYQAPQQNSPQQGSQQQPQQGQQQQPSQAPTQTQQPQQGDQNSDQQNNDMQKQCQAAQNQMQLVEMGLQLISGAGSLVGGMIKPGQDPGIVQCEGCDQSFKNKDGSDRNSDSNKDRCPAGFEFLGGKGPEDAGWNLTDGPWMSFKWLCGKSNGTPQKKAGPELHADHPHTLPGCPIPPGGSAPSVAIGQQDTVTSTVTAQLGASGGPGWGSISGNISKSVATAVTKTDTETIPMNAQDGFMHELFPIFTETPLNILSENVKSAGLFSNTVTSSESPIVSTVVRQPTGDWVWQVMKDSAGQPIPAPPGMCGG